MQKLQAIKSQSSTQVKNEIFKQPKTSVFEDKELNKKWNDDFLFSLPELPTHELEKTNSKQKNKAKKPQLAMKY